MHTERQATKYRCGETDMEVLQWFVTLTRAALAGAGLTEL